MVVASSPRTPAPTASVADPGRENFSISQAAALLGVSRVSIWRWIKDGQLPAARLGHRTTRIRREDLEQLLVRIRPHGARPHGGRNQQPTMDEPNRERATGPFSAGLNWAASGESAHFVQFYETDDFLMDRLAEYLGGALRAGQVAAVIATTTHRAALDTRLAGLGLDLATASASGRYLSLDAHDTLNQFLVDGEVDRERFFAVAGSIIQRAAQDGRQVRIFGEMVALLALDENHSAALRLEALWNEIQQTQPFSLACAYPLDKLAGESFADLIQDVCATHARVIPAESYSATETSDDRLRAVAVLQQKASWLELEIAERKRAQERLQEALNAERAAREAAELALHLRNEFISIASHELKTPLTSLSGYAQLVLRRLERESQVEPGKVMHALRAISGQADKLSTLVNQLLDVTRLDAGKLSLDRRLTDLVALLEQSVAAARGWSEQHEITLDAPNSLLAWVDPLRLEQVLTNLLDNAIKYSPDGGQVNLALSPLNPDTVELSVQDSGLGVDLELRDRIFERFFQAHAAGHRSGMGLGLYISRQIVELHQGEIRAEFPPSGGTRMVVRLPIRLETKD